MSVLSHITFAKPKSGIRSFLSVNFVWSREIHCVKSVRIRNFHCPYFPAFGLDTKRYFVSLRIQPECRKIRTRKNSVFEHIWHSVIYGNSGLKCRIYSKIFIKLIILTKEFKFENLFVLDYPKILKLWLTMQNNYENKKSAYQFVTPLIIHFLRIRRNTLFFNIKFSNILLNGWMIFLVLMF